MSAAPVMAQDADAAEEFAEVLEQIRVAKLNIARQEVYLDRQQARIDSLETQLAEAPEVTAAVPAVLAKFYAGLEAAVENDPPFLRAERYTRLNKLKETLDSEDARLASKVASALQVGEIEANYGYEIKADSGDHPTDARRLYKACVEDAESEACNLTQDLREDYEAGATIPELELQILDGSYVRYGRLSLAYIDRATDEVLVYVPNPEDGVNWREARGAEVSDIRRNLRVARGEAAPDVIRAPIVKMN